MSRNVRVTLPRGARSLIPGNAPPGNFRLGRSLSTAEQALRHDLLLIRSTMRELIQAEKIAPDSSIFYSGFNPESDKVLLEDFQAWLASRGHAKTIYLESTNAGRFLGGMSKSFLANRLDASEWNNRMAFGEQSERFVASIIGFWRELSARYAARAAGTVHLLLHPDRVELLDTARAYWLARRTSGSFDQRGFLESQRSTAFARSVSEKLLRYENAKVGQIFTEELKVLGLAEFPVIYGWIAKNTGVDKIIVYTCNALKGTGSGLFQQIEEESIDAILPRRGR